jgi:hypothetical protein
MSVRTASPVDAPGPPTMLTSTRNAGTRPTSGSRIAPAVSMATRSSSVASRGAAPGGSRLARYERTSGGADWSVGPANGGKRVLGPVPRRLARPPPLEMRCTDTNSSCTAAHSAASGITNGSVCVLRAPSFRASAIASSMTADQ